MVTQTLGQATMICGGILLIMAGTSGNPWCYEIQPFNNNPGLFYEKLETICTIQNHWRFFIFMDSQKLQEHLQFDKMKSDIQKIYDTCPNRSKSSNSKDMVKVDRLNEKLYQLETRNEDLTGILMELHQNIPHEIIPPSTMHKRRVPLLGFIGSILGPVIGVMTSDDTEEYDEAINDIYKKQNNLSKIIGKQTHIMKAEVNNIHQDLNKKTKQIQTIQKELNKTIHKIESQGQYWNDYVYYEKIFQWSTHFELKLEHLHEILKQFIKITEYA